MLSIFQVIWWWHVHRQLYRWVAVRLGYSYQLSSRNIISHWDLGGRISRRENKAGKNQIQQLRLNGRGKIISSVFLFKEEHPRFTTVPFKPFTDHRGQRTRFIKLLNAVLKCGLKSSVLISHRFERQRCELEMLRFLWRVT